jgi:hypothetical protein
VAEPGVTNSAPCRLATDEKALPPSSLLPLQLPQKGNMIAKARMMYLWFVIMKNPD